MSLVAVTPPTPTITLTVTATPTPTPLPTVTERIVTVQQQTGVQWGDVATWSASFLTGVSVLLAVLLLIREHRKGERAQALDFVVWHHYDRGSTTSYEGPYECRIFARNVAQYPVFKPFVAFNPQSRRRIARQSASGERLIGLVDAAQPGALAQGRGLPLAEPPATILAGDEIQTVAYLPLPPSFYDIEVNYSDSMNRRWRRNLTTGKLVRIGFWRRRVPTMDAQVRYFFTGYLPMTLGTIRRRLPGRRRG